MDATTIIILIIAGFVILLIAGFIFKKVLPGLIDDYLLDGLLSTLDEPLGAGIAGIEVGDWIAAFIVFWYEEKTVGKFWAAVSAWEVSNFFPFSLIPGLGVVLDIFNAIPTGTFIRIFFSQEEEAKEKSEFLEKNLSFAPSGEAKELLKKAKKDIENDAPAHAVPHLDKAIEMIMPELQGRLSEVFSTEEQELKDIIEGMNKLVEQDLDMGKTNIKKVQDAITRSAELLGKAKQAMDNKNIQAAYNCLQQMDTIIRALYKYGEEEEKELAKKVADKQDSKGNQEESEK